MHARTVKAQEAAAREEEASRQMSERAQEAQEAALREAEAGAERTRRAQEAAARVAREAALRSEAAYMQMLQGAQRERVVRTWWGRVSGVRGGNGREV